MTLKLKVRSKLPAKLLSGAGITVSKDGLIYTVGIDLSEINPVATFDPLQEEALLFNPLTKSYSMVSIAAFISGGQPTRVITEAGDVNIAPADGLIILAKTVAEDTNFNLPAASIKIGAVKIVDWKGVANSQSLKVIPNGSETLNGQSDWTLAGQYSSAVFTPISGLGYAV